MTGETIYALASAPGRGGIAVIRISGESADAALTQLTNRPLPAPRQAVLRRLFGADGRGGADLLDTGLVLWFPAPASFTGEDVVELQVHGGRAVIAAVLAALGSLPGLRPAEPGEFSRRAFAHGRLDLTAAEGLADLVAAETATQRRQALAQLGGALGARYDGWRDRLLRALAHLEAVIDFADEDFRQILPRTWPASWTGSGRRSPYISTTPAAASGFREGIDIAVIGPPNAGKSTLVNALAHREVAIVSPHPGTTRDVIEVPLDIGGYAVVLSDTAGLREADQEGDAAIAERVIEGEGVRRARARAGAADLVLAVFDGAVWPAVDPETARLAASADALRIVSKSDLGRVAAEPTLSGWPLLALSAVTGEGLDALRQALVAAIEARFASGGAPVLSRLRHRQALTAAVTALGRFASAAAIEEAAEEVRVAVGALGRITGRVDVEDMLDVIFSDFCIGK